VRFVLLLMFCGGCRAAAGPASQSAHFSSCVRPAAEAQVTTLPPLPPLPAGVRELPSVVARARQAVVSVIAGRAAEGPSPGPDAPQREHALGSGFLIEPDGLVLTSRHVIEGADDVRVELDDGRSFPGSVAARDAVLDVALIRLEGARGLPVAALGSSDEASVGDRVIAIGNPFGLGPSVRLGILSATARGVEDGPSGEFLQTDAAVNPGDSGGPLLDVQGRVIGINTAVLEHGQGISFAVPIDDVRAVLRELQRTGRVTRGHTGMSFQAVDASLARALALAGPEGALVSEVDTAGPAFRAGVRPGDLITGIDGQSVARIANLVRELGRRKPGEVVRLAIQRGACAKTISVLLDRLPNRDGDAEAHLAPPPKDGTAGLRLSDAEGGGARVDALDPKSTAADGLRRGDVVVEVDRTPVHGAADAARRLTRPPTEGAGHTALLRVRRADSFLYVGIDLPRN
jgi:serine protease Do